jgi:hypothetical protein
MGNVQPAVSRYTDYAIPAHSSKSNVHPRTGYEGPEGE